MQAQLASPRSQLPIMSGMSYNEFFSLPQWTPHYQQSYPFLQQPYAQPANSPCPQQYTYTYTDVLGSSQSHPFIATNNVRPQTPRRKRASKPKVRTGCTTCKVSRASRFPVMNALHPSITWPSHRPDEAYWDKFNAHHTKVSFSLGV